MKRIDDIECKTIAFQGMAGAYSDLACRAAYPELTTMPCVSFEAAFRAVREGLADLAMIPVDNSLAGRDIANLKDETGLIGSSRLQDGNSVLPGKD